MTMRPRQPPLLFLVFDGGVLVRDRYLVLSHDPIL